MESILGATKRLTVWSYVLQSNMDTNLTNQEIEDMLPESTENIPYEFPMETPALDQFITGKFEDSYTQEPKLFTWINKQIDNIMCYFVAKKNSKRHDKKQQEYLKNQVQSVILKQLDFNNPNINSAWVTDKDGNFIHEPHRICYGRHLERFRALNNLK